MKKLLALALLAGLAGASVAQVTKTILNQRVAMNLKAGDTITVLKNAPAASQKGAVLIYKVPTGKSLRGNLSLSGELN